MTKGIYAHSTSALGCHVRLVAEVCTNTVPIFRVFEEQTIVGAAQIAVCIADIGTRVEAGADACFVARVVARIRTVGVQAGKWKTVIGAVGIAADGRLVAVDFVAWGRGTQRYVFAATSILGLVTIQTISFRCSR